MICYRKSGEKWAFYLFKPYLGQAGWPQHRENREFGCKFFQTGKTQGI